jgi:hypothetical protein
VTIYWGPSDGGDDKDAWAEHVVVGTVYGNGSKFSADLNGLLYGIDYHYRCYATNDYGEGWSESTNFLTLPPSSGSGGSGGMMIRVNSSADDAEELADGTMYLDSSDLEFAYDAGRGIQSVGMCFDGLSIPDGVTITNAYVQFKADETDSADVTVTIKGEATDNASTFGTSSGDISSRDMTTAYTEWSPLPWNSVGSAGVDQRTPDLSAIITEIVGRPGWSDDNSLAIMISGTEVNDNRVAESWNGDSGGAPALQVWWATNAPAVSISNAPATDLTSTSATFNATLEATGSVFDVHVYWGTSDGTDNADAWGNTNVVGSYTNLVSVDLSFSTQALSSNTVYYYTFSASNAATNIWGVPSVQFIAAMPSAPVVDNSAGATQIGIGEATVNGMVVNGDAATAYVCWQGGSDAGTGGGTGGWDNVVSMGVVNKDIGFSTSVTGLYYGLTYYYRCYVTNEYGVDWSGSMSFTTLPPANPGSGTLPVTNGLQLWLDAGEGIVTNAGGEVTSWMDRSSGGNDAVDVGDGNSPSFAESAINGKPAVSFDGSDRLGYSSVPARTVFFVCTVDSAGASLDGILGFYNNDKGIRRNGADAWQHPGNGDTFNNPGGSTFRVNGNSTGSAPRNNWHVGEAYRGDSVQSFNRVGGYYQNRDIPGDVAEVLIYDTTLSGGELDEIGGYLEWKYGIGTSYPEYTPPPVVANLSITNVAATDVLATMAELNAGLSAGDSVFHIWAFWGQSNGVTNAAAWAEHGYVGVYTDGVFAVTHVADGLDDDTTYYYTFMASNAVDAMWATSSLSFRTEVGDADGDGLLDEWEMTHFDDMDEDGTGDADGDGSTDLGEFVAGTDPTNALSKLEVEAIDGDEPFMVIHWSSVSNRIYSIWGSTNILTNDWWNIESNIPAVPPLNTWTVTPASAEFEYYRIGVEAE